MNQDSMAAAPVRQAHTTAIAPPSGWLEALLAAVLRVVLRIFFKGLMRPPFPVWMQRFVLQALSLSMPSARGTEVRHAQIGRMPVERVSPVGGGARAVVTLYLHGGAFCTGSARSHRSLTTAIAKLSQGEVLVPDYRLAPENPFPAQIDDCVTAYRQLLADGYRPQQIAVAGDSAGGTLAHLATAAFARAGLPPPGAVVLLSPAMDLGGASRSARERRQRDPLVNLSWARQAMDWYAPQHDHPLADPKAQDLSHYPPTLIQVGEDEVLYDDAVWAARALAQAGRTVELETYQDRWHVFQIHAGTLPGATAAVARISRFIVKHCGAAVSQPQASPAPAAAAAVVRTAISA